MSTSPDRDGPPKPSKRSPFFSGSILPPIDAVSKIASQGIPQIPSIPVTAPQLPSLGNIKAGAVLSGIQTRLPSTPTPHLPSASNIQTKVESLARLPTPLDIKLPEISHAAEVSSGELSQLPPVDSPQVAVPAAPGTPSSTTNVPNLSSIVAIPADVLTKLGGHATLPSPSLPDFQSLPAPTVPSILPLKDAIDTSVSMAQKATSLATGSAAALIPHTNLPSLDLPSPTVPSILPLKNALDTSASIAQKATSLAAGSAAALIPDSIPTQLPSLSELPKVGSISVPGELSALSNVVLSSGTLSSKLHTIASSPLVPQIPGMSLISEVTPLLRSVKRIPWFQVSILLFLQVVEPLTTHVVSPFTPELIRESIGNIGTNEQLSYVAQLLQSMFYFMEASTVLYWSKTSDKVGRKPVILIGMIGSSLSMMCFGFSQSLWGSIVSRSLMNGLNGNAGVIKGMMAEMVDTADLARVRSQKKRDSKDIILTKLARYTLSLHLLLLQIGPIINDYLSGTSEKSPDKVSGQAMVFNIFMYLLACSVPTMLSIAAFVVTFLFLKETVKAPVPVSSFYNLHVPSLTPDPENPPSGHAHTSAITALHLPNVKVPTLQEGLSVGGAVASAVVTHIPFDPVNKLLSMRSLLNNMPVLIAVGNFGCLSLVDITFRTIQPLFLARPVSLGGLGLPEDQIQNILSAYGVLNGFVQLMLFTKIYNHLGPKKTFTYGVASAVPLFLMFPVTSFIARMLGQGILLWAAVAVQVVLPIGLSLAFGSIFMYITASSPDPRSLGATNGLSQMLANAMRGIGPGIATGLFKTSIEQDYMGGNYVYVVLALIATFATVAAWFLPRKLWSKNPLHVL
ncbi:hypothetical protein DXG01_008141 [Tephrocybe rancida]|nr:hypothetical protein DXG01_008141 [Tephrocybe rancida]